MTVVSTDKAKAELADLIERAAAGEEIVIASDGKPVAKLTGYTPPKKPRVGGQLRGKIWVADDFDELDEETLDLFYNGPIFPEDDNA